VNRLDVMVLGLVLLPLPASADTRDKINKIDKLAAECQAGAAKPCRKLTDIARKEKDEVARAYAVGKVSDQAVLADIATTAERGFLRAAAVEKLSDQAVLSRIAKTDMDRSVRWAALQRIGLGDVRYAAISEPYPRCWEPEGLREAVERGLARVGIRVADQQYRAYQVRLHLTIDARPISATYQGAGTRYSGAEATAHLHLDDYNLDITESETIDPSSMLVGQEYAKPDDAPTCTVAVRAATKAISAMAATCIKGDRQPFICDLAKTAKDWRVREAAAGAIMAEAELVALARTDGDRNVRSAAVKSAFLTDQAVLAAIARADPDAWVRAEAAYKLSDAKVLVELARNDKDAGVRETAVTKLTDPAALAEIARTDPTPRVRGVAKTRLEDLAKGIAR
jgi:hypothetical protein